MTLRDHSIWLDVQGAQNREHFDRGIPRYVRDHAVDVVAAAPEAIARVGLNPRLPVTANLDGFVGTGMLGWNTQRPEVLPDVFHVLSPFELHLPLEELWPTWARTGGVRTAVTLYDLIPLVFADHYLQDPGMRARYLTRAEFIRQADRVFAISQTSADDATRLLGVPEERISVIDAGVSGHFGEAFNDAEDARRVVAHRFPQLKPGFMLYVAGIEYRKNLDRLIQGYGRTTAAFRAEHQLVITCRMRAVDEEHLRRVAREAGVGERELVLTNYIPDAELAALYWTCTLFVFASFYEGSGLPILEAMACDRPVVASNTSTSPEILGDLEGTFDPYDIDDIGRVLEATATDPVALERLRERSRERVRHYSWRRTAELTLEGYEQMVAEPTPRRTGGKALRPRLALYTPWLPERSGIAVYNKRLVRELARDVDVDVIVAGDVEDYEQPDTPGVRLIADRQLRAAPGVRVHDRVVHCMGNSHFHHHVFEALQRVPGTVVCHDVRFGGFFGTFVKTENPVDPVGAMAHRLREQYGARLGRDFLDGYPTPWQQSDLGIYMTRDVVRGAEAVVVHSGFAADVVRLDAGEEAGALPPIHVLPHAAPPVRPREERPVPEGGGTIVSFGIVSAVKMPEVLVDAMAQVLEARPRARLLFAGGADDAELQRLRDHAEALGVGHAVEVLGHVDDAGYERLLQEADVAVQLRRIQNGEASGAITDALTAGLPTVVTALGWANELPADALARVPLELTGPVLAQAVLRILDDPQVAASMSRAAQAYAQDVSFERVARQYLDLLGLA